MKSFQVFKFSSEKHTGDTLIIYSDFNCNQTPSVRFFESIIVLRKFHQIAFNITISY